MTRENDSKARADHFLAICDNADHSRPGSREALRQLMCEHVDLGALVVKEYGDAAHRAEAALVRHASGGNVLVDEATRAWLSDARRVLAEPDDTELERMLVHRAALCSLAVNTADQLRAEKWKGGIDTDTAAFWDRHASRLQDDFLKACRALATVRKLRRPVVQVNIADKQINVTG